MKKRTRRTKGIFTWRQLTGALLGCGIALLGMLILSLLLSLLLVLSISPIFEMQVQADSTGFDFVISSNLFIRFPSH